VVRDTTGGPVSIGGSVALIVIGAILRFAVSWNSQYVDIQTLGLILMLGGIVCLIIALVLIAARRRARAGAQVVEERRYIEPPP
jgi:Domain of unknown function (DUF6458)